MGRNTFSAVGHSPTDPHRAEVLANSFSSPPTKEQLLSLFDVLPSENPARGRPGDFSFTTGAWSKDGQFGLRKHSTMFPAVTAALTSYASSQDAQHTFSAVALFADLQTQPHRDVNNDPEAPNMLLALTSFAGGQVWQHDDFSHGVHWQFVQGQHLPGRLLDPTCGPCFLASHQLHFTLPCALTRRLLACRASQPLRRLESARQTCSMWSRLCRSGSFPCGVLF